MSKRTKNILTIIIPIVIVAIILQCSSLWFENEIESRFSPLLAKSPAIDYTNKGISIIKNGAEKQGILIFGSSELSSGYDYGIPRLFPNTTANYDISLIGQAGDQDLINCIRFAALSDELAGKRIVIIVSPQWFFNEEIDTAGFQSRFSDVQYYRAMSNPKLDSETKKYISSRVSKLTQGQNKLQVPHIYSKLINNNNFFTQTVRTLLSPYYFIEKNFLEYKEKAITVQNLQKFKPAAGLSSEIKDINWEESEKKAEELTKPTVSTNDMYIIDWYYNAYIASNLETVKNHYANVNCLASNELQDFKTLMSICYKTGIKPYIVIQSSNGFYYDYAGFTADKRNKLYDELANTCKKYRFDYVDLRDKEYEPYFYEDIMHPSRKGCVYIAEKISKNFSKSS